MKFERIYKKYKNDVYNYVYWRVLDREDALDITQEVFIKVYRNLDGFKGRSSIKTWLFAIARNTVTNYLTRNKKKEETELEESLFLDNFNRSEAEMKRTLLLALDKLPLEHAEILRLYYFDRFSYKEIAELMGINIGTVKSRLNRAKKYLKAELEKRL